MGRVISRASVLSILIAYAIAAGLVGGTASAHTSSFAGAPKNNPICSRLGKSIQGSQGLQVWCFGAQQNGPSASTSRTGTISGSFGSNVNAANPNEDRSASGVQVDGQSETSIAAVGNNVIEAWNDATGFVSSCGAPMNKEELIGWGFSSNGGASFTDEGGLPNNNCTTSEYVSDPGVEAWSSGGTTYFYISAMYYPVFSLTGPPPSDIRTHIAIAACSATGGVVSCSQPIVVASSSQCSASFFFCGMLDKDYISIDPVRGRLYVSYTEFSFNFKNFASTNTIDLAVCDIGTSTGGIGPAGGTAGQPICFNGGNGSVSAPAPPYLTVTPNDVNGCENEGAYPAVDVKSGDVYVAYEHNWATNVFGGASPACLNSPTIDVLKFIPASCLTLTATAACGPTVSNGVNVFSLDATMFPGYNRFPANDFPRIAVSDPAGTVSLVWNDARLHPLGDILLQSFTLGSLTGVQSAPVVINSDRGGGMHFMPALRNTDANGNLNISFYQRASASTALTNVQAALGLDPRTTSSPASNTLVTTKPSNWLLASSLIIPNFGDYTDNYVIASAAAPYTGTVLYVAWSDGRLGIPQPFEASAGT